MSERKCCQDSCNYNNVEYLSNNCNSSCEYNNNIRRDLLEIGNGIQEQNVGLNDIIGNNRCRGVSELSEGISDVKEGLNHLVEDLRDVRLDCKEIRRIKKDIIEIEQGIIISSKGVQDVTRCNYKLGIREIQGGICTEDAGFHKLVKDITSILYNHDFDCNCDCNYQFSYGCCDYDLSKDQKC